MILYYLFLMVVQSTLTHGYDTPSGPQYHIQTDEGPERYFRYQTLSGQYRKEKRLEDGTVVGSYAWIDDDGILRQRDYIADNAGYRILKTKNLYVGRNAPVGEAVKSAKKYPASAGTLVNQNAASTPYDTSYKSPIASRRPVVRIPYSSTPAPYTPTVISTTQSSPPYVELSSNGVGYSTATSTPFVTSTERPYVEITPHSIASSTVVPLRDSTTLSPDTAYYSSSNAAPETPYYSSTIVPFTRTTQNEQRYISATPETLSSVEYLSPLSGNSIEYNPYVSSSDNNYVFQNGPTYPIDKNGHTYRGQIQRRRRIGNGYEKQYPEYDGVSVTNDGFRYYIPRAYHEEQSDGDKKSGSFGYIDPFGIRRVIYYNAEPGSGFQHRKNNRYVGFDATPYDPRPY